MQVVTKLARCLHADAQCSAVLDLLSLVLAEKEDRYNEVGGLLNWCLFVQLWLVIVPRILEWTGSTMFPLCVRLCGQAAFVVRPEGHYFLL